jgi:hypothetical protein
VLGDLLARLHAGRLTGHLGVVGRKAQLDGALLLPQPQQRLEGVRRVVDRGPRVAVGEAVGDGEEVEVARVAQVGELGPGDGGRDGGAGLGPQGVGRGDRAVAVVLVEVDLTHRFASDDVSIVDALTRVVTGSPPGTHVPTNDACYAVRSPVLPSYVPILLPSASQ